MQKCQITCKKGVRWYKERYVRIGLLPSGNNFFLYRKLGVFFLKFIFIYFSS